MEITSISNRDILKIVKSVVKRTILVSIKVWINFKVQRTFEERRYEVVLVPPVRIKKNK